MDPLRRREVQRGLVGVTVATLPTAANSGGAAGDAPTLPPAAVAHQDGAQHVAVVYGFGLRATRHPALEHDRGSRELHKGRQLAARRGRCPLVPAHVYAPAQRVHHQRLGRILSGPSARRQRLASCLNHRVMCGNTANSGASAGDWATRGAELRVSVVADVPDTRMYSVMPGPTPSALTWLHATNLPVVGARRSLMAVTANSACERLTLRAEFVRDANRRCPKSSSCPARRTVCRVIDQPNRRFAWCTVHRPCCPRRLRRSAMA